MGKSVRNTNPVDLSDEVAQSLGLAPKSASDTGIQLPPKGQPQPKKQTSGDVADEIGQTLGLKKKDGGDDGSNQSSPIASPSASPSLDTANKNFSDRKLTGADVNTLANTDQGKQMGLPSLSQESKTLYAEAHNGPKRSDYVNSINKVVNDYYPFTGNQQRDNIRQQIKVGIMDGDQDAIVNLRDNVVSSIQKKINQRSAEITSHIRGMYADQAQDSAIESDDTIQQLKAEQNRVRQTMNEYGKLSMATGKDMQPWLKLDSDHPNMLTSEAADKLGKMIEARYGVESTGPNKEFDRMRTGFELIMKSMQMDANALLTAGLPTNDKETMKKAQDKLNTIARYRDMYDRLDTEQFPDVGLDRTARFLGDIIAENHPNKLIRTKEDVREAGHVADQRSPGFMQKYGKFVDAAAEKQGQGTFIPRGGGIVNEFLGGVQVSTTQMAVDLMKWTGRAVGDGDLMKKAGDVGAAPALKGTTESRNMPTKIVYDKQGKAYREMPNENYGTMPWNNFFRFAGESLPSLFEFIGAEKVAGGLLSGVANTALKGVDGLYGGYEAARVGKGFKDAAGLVGATYITSYNSNREFADANIEDDSSMGEAKKTIAANFLTLANAGIFHLLGATPSKMVESAMSKSMMPDVVKMFEENDWEQLSKKAQTAFVKDNLVPRAQAVMQKFGESLGAGAKLGGASVTDQKIKDVVGMMSNKNYKASTLDDNMRSFVSQALLMGMIGTPSAIAAGAFPHTTREALHQAGLYAPQYIDDINGRVDRGELDSHQAAGMISMIKTMQEELGKASQETNNDGTPLTTRQQRDLAIANWRMRAAGAMEENKMEPPKGGAKEAEEEAKEIKKQNNWQPIEETQVFKTVNGYDGNKPKSLSDIDPAKKYTYVDSDGMQHFEESGADLLHYLETGDIYDKEKEPDEANAGDENKVAETKAPPDAEGENNQPAEDKDKAPVAADVVEEAVKEGKIADNMAPHVKADPEQFLKDVADQALGYTRNEGERVRSNLPGAEQAARNQYGDKVVDAAVKLYPEEPRPNKANAPRGTMSEINNTLESEYKEYMQQVRPGASPAERSKIVSELPQRLYEKLAEDPSIKSDPEAQRQLSELRGRLQEEGAYSEESLRNLSGQELGDAPRKLLETFRSALAVPEVPREAASGDEARRKGAALQESYDRLIASGVDPEDSEMTRLKERIDKLSSKPTDNAQDDVEKTESVQRQEGSGRGEDAEGGDKENAPKEKVVPPEVTPPGAPPATPAKDNPVVGIRDSIVNEDRIHRGLKPLVKEFTRSWGANWNSLRRNIAKGFSPRNFIESTAARIAKGDRVTFSDYDYATLLFDRLNTLNDLALAKDQLQDALSKTGDDSQPNVSSLGQETAAQDLIRRFSDQLEQNDVVGRAIKSETGRALSAVQMMSHMNGELLRWSDEMAAYYNGNVPEKIKSFVERIQKEYKEVNDQLQARNEELLKQAAEGAFKQVQTGAGKAKKSTTVKGKELADKIRGLRDKLGTNNRSNLQSNVFGVPMAILDSALVTAANLVEGGARLIDAINEALKDVDFPTEEDKQKFIAHLQNEETPESPQAMRAGYIQDISSLAQEKGTTSLHPDMVAPLKKLMESYVHDGSVGSLDDLVKKTHDDLKEFIPDLDERQLRDAFSGYGAKRKTKGDAEKELTRLKEEARKVSTYQDSLNRPAGETDAEQAKRLGKAVGLRKDVEGYMREAGVFEEPPAVTPEAKNALALERIKKRTQSIISDLNEQILAGERKERNGVKSDAELDVLRAERKRLSGQLTEIENSKISPEEKIKRTEDALNRQISNYERQIRDGVDPMRPKEERPTTKQIEELRKRKNELKRQVEGLRNDTDPTMDAQQRAILKYNESLVNRIRDLEERLANKDYENPEPPVVDISKDRVTIGLEARLKKLQGDWYYTKRGVEMSQRPFVKKLMSFLSTTKRAFVLSRISTFGRLLAADVWANVIFEPSEAVMASTVGLLGTKIGFARKLSMQADRFGMPNSAKDVATIWKGEWDAIKSLKNAQTWKDFVSDAKHGFNELSLMYDPHAHSEVPKELRDHWQNIEHGLEAFGRAHGSVKGLSKRMEFTRSYAIRKAAARRRGADVENPVIQASIGAMAYQDALRHILMEDNLLLKNEFWDYNKGLRQLEKGGFGANVFALTLQEMMPIVKIPTSLVLNAGRSVLGAPLAGGVIAVRGLVELMSKGESKYGISKLSAEESDALLRNLRKGQVGMALMLAGYFAPNTFGASHYYQKGSDQPDGMEEGDVKFFGLTVPKWLADNPYLMAMKIGASLKASYDYYSDTQDNPDAVNYARSFFHTLGGAISETPIASTPSQALQGLQGYSGNFWYNQVKSTLEPGLLQEIAEDTDRKDGWFSGDKVKRKPTTLGESLKTGIPGARQDVGNP